MKAIVCDDELLALYHIEQVVSSNTHIDTVQAFSDSTKALDFVQSNDIDIAFLDIEMGVVSGIQIAKAIRSRSNTAYVVFTSGYDYAITAFEIKANGYLLKPYDQARVHFEIDCAYNQLIAIKSKEKSIQEGKITEKQAANKRVRFQTIPRFDMFVDGKLVPITSAKSKEFLALLVDKKGSSLTLDYIVSILFEDKDDSVGKAYFRVVLQRLNMVLKDQNLEELILHSKNQYSLNTDMVSCDYYDIIAGDKTAIATFMGEYMSEYSWSEDTCAILFRLTDPSSDK